MAKPTPELLPELEAICSLIPITCPFASSRGPPELPGLIEASVWIALSMPKLVSPSTVRVDLDQRHIGVGVESLDLRRDPVAVSELHEDLLCLLRRAAAVQVAAAG